MKQEINTFKRGNLANCLAFHDIDVSKINLLTVFNYVEELFQEYGLIPTRMGITKSADDSGSMKTYIRERKKLIELNPSNIIGVEVKATSYGSDDSQSDNIFSASFGSKKYGSFVLTLDDQLFSFDKQKILLITNKVIELLSPCYGYCYQREFKKGAIWYPYGVISGLPFFNCPERELIDAWNKRLLNDIYKTGDLRDVYPINLLVNAHLTREIAPNTTFEQFIDSDKRHGTLEKIADNYYAWIVDEDNIPLVREALRPSGMIIAG
jgi:hypothetical protein